LLRQGREAIGTGASVGHGKDGPPGVLLAPGKSVSFAVSTDAKQLRVIAMVAPTREEAGCLDYRLHVVDSDPGLFCFVALWRSEADLDAHLDEPHIADGLASIADHTEYVVVSRMTRIA